MPLEYKCPLYAGDIFEGEVQGLYVQAHVFSEPSSYGISEGRISQLTLYPNQKKSSVNVWPTMTEAGMVSPRKIARLVQLSKQQFGNLMIKRWIGSLRL